MHIHWYKQIAKQRIPFKWRVVKRCRCGQEKTEVYPILYREATPKERSEESIYSKIQRWV